MTSFNPKDLLPKSSTNTATSKRGVGSTKTQQNNISEDWTKFGKRQILSIGNKKRHNQHDDIEEDDNIDIGNESSSDEEEGRTSAVREKKKRKVVAKVSSTHQLDLPKANTDGSGIEGVGDILSTSNTKKKKKKKGKKERAKDKDTSIEQQSLNEDTTDAQQSTAKEAVASDKDANETNATKDDSITNTNNKSNTTTDTDNTATNTNTKRKRKKVRSRQKNIRKDNREVKPSHLIIGNDDYKGRPMTKETCEKLGIESKSEGKKNLKRKGNVAMFDSGQWVGSEDKNDTTTNDDDESNVNNMSGEDIKQPKEDVGNTLTRIGDCIVGNSSNIDNDDTTVGENILNEGSKKKKGKKHKKRKFKNLVVG